MKTLQLNDGNTIPALGFGTYKAKEKEGVDAVVHALDTGYRLIDTAAIYGNEDAVGKGIRQSGVAREDLFVTSKVWRGVLGYASTKQALDDSLRRLQLDYLDLYLIHWPANARNFDDWASVNAQTWRALEESQSEGKIRSIGISNFWIEHLEPLLDSCDVVPAVNQIEFHPGYWQPEVYAYCKEKDILVEAWAPLAKGEALNHETIRALADKYDKTEAQICLRWAIDRGTVPIPKSTTPERISENMDIFDFELTSEDIHTINQIPKMGFSGELPNEW